MDAFSNQTANVFDLTQLNQIRVKSNQSSKEDKDAALKQAASQFEAIFMQMLMKSIRQAEDVLASDSPFNSQTTKFYRDMHDQQMAMELSSNGSLGLADLIVRQLGGDSDNYTPANLLNISRRNFDRQNTDESRPESERSSAEIAKEQDKSQSLFKDAEDFVKSLAPMVDKAASYLGVPAPVIIAQAALETGWGQKIIRNTDGESSNNLFNIKADSRWGGDKVAKATLEFEQGQMVTKKENFRAYASLTESVSDYTNFLTSNSRYSEALKNGANVDQFLQGLQKAGYATDPNYASKIGSIVNKVSNLLVK